MKSWKDFHAILYTCNIFTNLLTVVTLENIYIEREIEERIVHNCCVRNTSMYLSYA